MISRLWQYIAGSYPPVISTIFAVVWAYGITGLFATVDPHPGPWRPDASTAVAAVTLMLNLLLMRIIDDIRDLDYDRVHDPKRPLVRGVVRTADLLGLYAVGSIALVLLNWNHAGLGILVGQLVYAALVLAVHVWLHWPDGDNPDNLLLTLLVSCPAQLLLHLYLYAGYLRSVGHSADRHGVIALVVVLLATLHLEAAKKIVRAPRAGERTYVTTLGLPVTVGIAVVVPIASAVLLLMAARYVDGALYVSWSALVLAPVALPLLGLWQFRRGSENRWRAKYAVQYVLLTFGVYTLTGLSRRYAAAR